MVDEVRAVPGVALARGGVPGSPSILDKNGEPIQPGGAPTFGTSVGDRRLVRRRRLSARAAADRRPDEVAIDARTAEKAGFRAR